MSIIVRPIQAALVRDTDFFTKMVSFLISRIPSVKFTWVGNVSKPMYVIAEDKVRLGTLLLALGIPAI